MGNLLEKFISTPESIRSIKQMNIQTKETSWQIYYNRIVMVNFPLHYEVIFRSSERETDQVMYSLSLKMTW